MGATVKTKTPKAEWSGSITGRDGYIVAKALAYAIEVIGSLPERQQEWSDREEMKKIFEAAFSEPLRAIVADSAHVHLNPDAAPLAGGLLAEWRAAMKARAAVKSS
jgi:hypothetical protein